MQTSIFQNIRVEPARNQLASVLKMLLENESVSERDTVFNGFRSRISQLRIKHKLYIRFREEKFKNQFGRESTFRRHYLMEIDKEKGLELYREINK
jgi:hypothetical protein